MKLLILGMIIGGLVGLAIPDAKEVIGQPVVESPCDPKRTQVLRMDNAERITQVLDRNIQCVVVTR